MADSFDGETISDVIRLAEFTSWLRRSTRSEACVLVSQKSDGRPVAPLGRIMERVDGRAVVTMLSNDVQEGARGQLGSVNPYKGAVRIFPAGDMWTEDPRLVRFIRDGPSAAEFLEAVDGQLDVALVNGVRSSVGSRGGMTAGSWKDSGRGVHTPDTPVGEQRPSRPSLADVRGRERLYRIDTEHVGPCEDFILNESREVPCVLVSLPAEGTEPCLDVDALLDEIGDDAVVLRIMDHGTQDRLNGSLPVWARAYDGACRFLPPYSGRGARLRRLRGPEDSAGAVKELSELVWDAAYADGYTVDGAAGGNDGARAGSIAGTAPSNPKRADVMMVVDDVAYVGHAGSMPQKVDCSHAAELAGMPVDRLVCKGQSIAVRPTSEGGFELMPEWCDADKALVGYVPGATIVGVASAVYADMFVVTLYPKVDGVPAVEARVHGPDLLAHAGVDPDMDLRPIIRKGEPVALRIEDRSGTDWRFSTPASGDKVATPAALLGGGPAWVDAADAFAYLKRIRDHRSLADMPLDGLFGSIHSMAEARDTIRRLYERLRTMERLNHELDSANGNLRRSNDDLRKDNRDREKARDRTNPLAPFTGLFPSVREELDWQLRAQSLLQFNLEDRMARPLGEWSYSTGFFDSLEECEQGDMSRMSLLRTMLFVLMGRDDLNGARAHRLREGRGGDDAARLDENGNCIYRVNVHGQYRLHYTRDAARHVTFRSVGTHDAELR